MSNIQKSEIIAQAVMIVEDYEKVKKENDKLKETIEDYQIALKRSQEVIKAHEDIKKSLKERVKQLDCEVYVLQTHKELNTNAQKRTEHYTKLMNAKDREIDTLRDEVAYLESKLEQIMSEKVEVTHHYITEEEWRV
jgi:chromosome segregation ATPase